MVKHRTVGIPEDLIEEIKKEIESDNTLGYRSHSEFIIDAARRRLEEIRKLKRKS